MLIQKQSNKQNVGQLKNADGINADGTQNMFVLATLEKIEERRLTLSQGNVTVLKKGNKLSRKRVKLINT